MSTTHRSLTAQASERATRLAALKNLKRKQPPSPSAGPPTTDDPPSPAQSSSTTPPDVTSLHLSARNYDPTSRGPKLGFEHPPTASLAAPTLEQRAALLQEDAEREKAEQAEDAGKGLDLWRLRPGRVNEDLKRDLEGKMERVAVRTENAIARLVRRRVEEQRGKEADAEGEGVGMGGGELVEGVHMREREVREEVERERESEKAGAEV